MRAETTVKENHEFRRIYRKGRSAVSACMVVYCQKNRQGRSRLGVTVSTKLGKAVVRNRVRRQLREIYRLHREEMKPGYDVIVVARVRAAHTAYQKLEASYLEAVRQLDLWKEMEP
ncbi:MAG: ribonuclease P protein component [Oscillospiraceae bacterium]|jgi:ribonuclease P protein component|nr:ribonuclease P protein component [Oscillospiraceae bacterium]